MAKNAQQRRDRVLGLIRERRFVILRDLAREIAMPEATIRRDLRILARTGEVECFHGGAGLRNGADFSFHAKELRHRDAKRIIGRLAAGLVQEGDHIFLDSGTSCFEMTPHLKLKTGLSIIVNSARLALELDRPANQVILLGGQYRPERMDTIGPLATSMLEQLRGYVAFIGADGLHQDFGLAAADIESAQLYRLAVRNARRTILLADSSKLHSSSLYQIAGWDQISGVVTECPPPPEWTRFLEDQGITIVTDQTPVVTDQNVEETNHA